MITLAHKVLIIVYHILRTKKPYADLGVDSFPQRDRGRIERHHIHRDVCPERERSRKICNHLAGVLLKETKSLMRSELLQSLAAFFTIGDLLLKGDFLRN